MDFLSDSGFQSSSTDPPAANEDHDMNENPDHNARVEHKLDVFPDAVPEPVSVSNHRTLETFFQPEIKNPYLVVHGEQVPRLVVPINTFCTQETKWNWTDLTMVSKNNQIIEEYGYFNEEDDFNLLVSRVHYIVSNNAIQVDMNYIDAPIVATQELLSELMRTPLDKDTWEIYAWKVNGIIYLKRRRGPDGKQVHPRSGSQYEAINAKINFKRLMTQSISERYLPVNESERHIKLSSVSLNGVHGVHNVVTMSEIEAMDSEGNDVVMHLEPSKDKSLKYKDDFYGKHCLDIWSKSIFTGTNKWIVCFKTTGTPIRVDDVQVMNTDSEYFRMKMMADTGRTHWDPRAHTSFIFRFMTFLKDIMQDTRTREGRVVTFKFSSKRCSRELMPSFQEFYFNNLP